MRRAVEDAAGRARAAGGLPLAVQPSTEGENPDVEETLPGAPRSALGSCLVAVLVAGGTLAAWAAQPAVTDPPVVTQTDFVSVVPPEYPQAAIAAREQGKITVKLLIDQHGNAGSPEIYDADPPQAEAVFANASIAAARQWKFHPKTEAGRLVAAYVLVPITFALDDD